jgi:hypothetical protein
VQLGDDVGGEPFELLALPVARQGVDADPGELLAVPVGEAVDLVQHLLRAADERRALFDELLKLPLRGVVVPGGRRHPLGVPELASSCTAQ